jgi:prepilin-type N-terminal cleavage/methylation domain-containing protein
MRKHEESGFSLVELVVAMLITLIISGAIYALIGSGSNMFRREPAISERQQNIRIAMEMLSRDAEAAVTYIPSNDTVVGGANGPTDTVTIALPRNDCAAVPLTPGTFTVASSPGAFPACVGTHGMVVVHYRDGTALPAWMVNANSHSTTATFGSTSAAEVALNGTVTGSQAANGGADAVIPVELVTYRLAADVDGVLSLWRSPSAGYTDAGVATLPAAGNDAWLQVARGIDELQVQYRTQAVFLAAGAPADTFAGTTIASRVREVSIVMGSRTTGDAHLQGGRPDANGINAVRGQMLQLISPRPMLAELASTSNGAGGYLY